MALSLLSRARPETTDGEGFFYYIYFNTKNADVCSGLEIFIRMKSTDTGLIELNT